MRLAALFSGGKDSTLAIQLAEAMGHNVDYLITVKAASEESYYFHYPNIWVTSLQARAMGRRQIMVSARSASRDDELRALRDAVELISDEVDGLLSGVNRSRSQHDSFQRICDELGLEFLTPLWMRDPREVLKGVVSSGITAMIVGVAAMGLGRELLGRIIDHELISLLNSLSERYDVNVLGEGGEFETLVLDSPLFKKRIKILEYEIRWSGYSGMLLVGKARLAEK
jgi:ABC transporter with metal-binding/Fe-S-binding domain ATP-binding protein